jgi:cell division protein FtsQ
MDLSLTAIGARLSAGGRTRPALVRALRRVPRPPVRVLAAVLAVLVVLGAGWTWLRHSSLAAVREVEVTGLTTSEQPRVRAALESAALDMSTLDVQERELREAVAAFPSVAGLEVRGDFPHALHVHVIERRPVALLSVGAGSVPVAADGRLLRGVEAGVDLPIVESDPLVGDTLTERRTLDAVRILAATPAALTERVRSVESDRRGFVLDLAGGPDLVFGTAGRPRAKWAAAARVLAEPSAGGAVYLDVRVPERVAAGGLAPVDPSTADTAGAAATAPGTTPSDPAAAAAADTTPTLDSQVELETSEAAMPLAQVQPD